MASDSPRPIELMPIQRISSSGVDKKLPMRVLAVEDNPINMKILKKYLERMEVSITFASDGQEAVDTFRSKPVGFFELVFMDLHMPKVLLLKFCESILF